MGVGINPDTNPMQQILKRGVVVLVAAAALACGGTHPEKYLAKGNRAYQQGRYAEASIDYRKSVASDPNFGEAYYRLGMAEGKLGHIPQSIAAFSRAADLMPQNDDAAAELGELYLLRYQADRDAPAYQQLNAICARLLARNPRSFAALRLKGYLAVADGKPDQALDFFSRANSIQPLEPDVAIALTQTLLVEGRIADAIELGRSLIKAHPDAGPIYDTLYHYYVEAGNLRDAEQMLAAKVKNNPTDPFPVRQLAEHYWQHHQPAEAAQTIRSLLKKPKAFPQAYLEIGGFYQWAGAEDEAVRAFEQGAGAHPGQKAAYERRAIESLILGGHKEQALERIAALLKAGSAGAEADELKSMQAGLLTASSRESDRKLAIQDLEELVRKSPRHTAWHFQLGRAYAAGVEAGISHYDQARRELEIVVKQQPGHTQAWLALAEVSCHMLDFAACQRYAEQALALDSSLASAYLLRASALVGLGQLTQARKEYDQLLRQNPGYREARLQHALLDVVEGQYAAAEKQFRDYYDPAHGDFRALEGLIALYFAEGHPEKAFTLLDTQAAIYPNSVQLAGMRASAAGRAGQWDTAVHEYERLRAREPEDAGILLALGDAYRHAGDFPRAIAVLEHARSLRPNDWRAPFLLGYAYQMTGKPAESEAAYRLCLRLNPGYPEALNNLAFLLAENSGHLDEALSLAQQAVKAGGDNPESGDTLGWIYLRQNHLESARQLFSTLAAENPRNPMLHYHYGLVLRQSGDRARGDGELRAALETGLAGPGQQAARELLAQK
jgi:tetratricopeptide (TPR) repeat protein